ncbi:tyrosine-type recombinase/integrase [Methylobacterium sp. WSM2598]|uniref:tyrosine-type recombinase/integrase n=1 Tax=Methylobacterium sp. WSM2598 TaxID=398261 RepID=UPI000365B1F0|nr:tyrosine-type recombinase/integrase [Methylobacterium sp. WSM2598]
MKRKRYLPEYCDEFTDVRGKRRLRFRMKGRKTVYPKAILGTPEFLAEYNAFIEGSRAPLVVGAARTITGSISDLIIRYYASAEWKGLADSTKATYRGIIERFRADHGDKPVGRLEREHIKRMIDRKADTPAAANNFLRIVRMLMQFAIAEKMRRDDPTVGVKKVRSKSTGFYTWSEEDIAAFEAHHPVGSRARLALALLLYTGQRRSDVIRMGRQHIRDGMITVRQQKTGTTLEIPVHPVLAAIITATPSDHLTFLVTREGKSFTAAGFGNWMREVCNVAGLKQCASHGLRKAACRRLAEAGCTANEIMAVSGHKNLREVTTYTAAAEQRRLASRAISTVAGMDREQALANGPEMLATIGSKPL